MWPTLSPPDCYVARRQRFLDAAQVPCVLGSGIARVRNFEGNRFPFRAESHFLYFVGRHLERALLCFEAGRTTLYAEPPDPDETLWHGPQPSLDALSQQLQIDVVPIEEFEAPEGVATLPPGDVESALWLEECLGRDVEAGQSELVECDRLLALAMIDLRLRHDQFAIAQMRQAARVTAAGHRAGMARTRAGGREAEVRAAIEAEMTSFGMSPAYNSIVTTHGEVLHNPTSPHALNAGDLLLVDAGAEGPEGWASDVTRTWPVSGRFDGIQAELYDAVLAAQTAAIEACAPGVRYRDVHRLAGRVLVEGLVQIGLLGGDPETLLERGVGAVFFPHGVGHLLGLDVHDMEDLGDLAGYAPGRRRSELPQERFLRLDRDLEPGMVVTIEPGFYMIPGLLEGPEFETVRDAIDASTLARLTSVRGIRIEDDVLITASGREVLTVGVPGQRQAVEELVG